MTKPILEKYPLSKLEIAHQQIKEHINHTPILTSASINEMLNAEVFFKCENFQKVGAFKMRGATYALSQLKANGLEGAVVTHSSGNHAQALAKAAKSLGLKAYIVMPETAPKVKVEAVKKYGGEITFCSPNLAARETEMEKIRSAKGATFIPPYDHEDIILGQATAAKELFEAGNNLDAVICPVGGGGLLAGTAIASQHLSPETKIWAAEPQGADDAYRSYKSGKLIPQNNPNTIADGLLTSVGELNFEIIQQLVDNIFCVDDEAIIAAMRLVWERMKIVIEPSSAVPLAALFAKKDMIKNKRVGLIVSGGNVDLGNYFDKLAKL